MSNAAITWSAGMHPGPGPKSVLFWLADAASDHSGEDWTCFPSIAALMDKTDMSRATVERHLSFLWREGYISRTRRRRADGKLGIYDFTLHREAERRWELKGARAKPEALEAVEEIAGCGADEPHVNLTYGPCVKSERAIRQNGAQPYVNLRGQEPLGEPLTEPSSGRAREPGSDGFEDAVGLWPEAGRKWTSWTRGQAAWALACGMETPERLKAAIRAAAADPDLAKGDHAFPGLHTWLSEERWRLFLPKISTEAEPPRTAFAGPAELRAAIVGDARLGEGFAGSFLDRARWDEGARTLTPATGVAAERLRQAAAHFDAHLVTLASGPIPASGGKP